MIPIVILHRNDICNFEIMLESIYSNTRYPFEVFVVDNNSSGVYREKVILFQKKYGYNLILSQKNTWLLGFNMVFNHKKWKDENYPYYVFSDCDIQVPALEGKCWLERMKDEMDSNACIGKLGISLKYDDIEKGEIYEKVVSEEQNFDAQPVIGSANHIAPVDTTLAIYRKDLYVGSKFRFSIGHASLVRPYYYTCRTNRNEIESRHLGWYNRGVTNNTTEQLKEKIICFSNYAAYIEPAALLRMPKYYQYYYKFVKPIMKMYWGLRVVKKLGFYYLSNFPRNINQLQNKLR